jgi:hypothetical protein
LDCVKSAPARETKSRTTRKISGDKDRYVSVPPSNIPAPASSRNPGTNERFAKVKFAHVTPGKHACDHMISDELATRHVDVMVANGVEVANRPVRTVASAAEQVSDSFDCADTAYCLRTVFERSR